MKRCLGLSLLVLGLAAGGSSPATRQPSLFPFADGNRWTLRDLRSGTAVTIFLRGRPGAFVLRGFPDLSALRVRRVGGSVEAWDSDDRRWEPFLRLGDPPRTRYRVDLGSSLLWRSVVVGVASKQAVVRDFRGRVLRGCTRLTFQYRSPVADAGLEELSFAPGIGPVRVVDTTIAGPRERALASFRVRRGRR